MAKQSFQLVDITGRGANFPLSPSPAKYGFYDVKGEDGLSIKTVEAQGAATTISSTGEKALAILHVRPPLLKIGALSKGVFVVPSYLASSAVRSPDEWIDLMLDPPSVDGRSTVMLLRPGDLLRIGQTKLRVVFPNVTNVDADVDVQVGSSIPAAPAAEDEVPTHSRGEKLRNSTHATIEVNRSRTHEDGQGISQGLDPAEQDPPSRPAPPLIAETPAWRQQMRGDYATTEGDDGGSQIPEAMQSQLRLSVGSINDDSQSYTQARDDESQEMLGHGVLFRKSTMSNGDSLQLGMERSVDCDFKDFVHTTSSSPPAAATNQNEVLDDGDSHAFNCDSKETESTSLSNHRDYVECGEYEEPFATAQSTGTKLTGEETNAVVSQREEETEDGAEDEADTTIIGAKVGEARDLSQQSASLTARGRKRKSDSGSSGPTSKKRKSVTPVSDSATPQPKSSSKKEATPSTRYKKPSSQSSAPASTRSSTMTPLGGDELPKSPRVIFSNSSIPNKPSIMNFLTQRSVKQVEKATKKGFDMLIVGTGELKTTSKLLTAIILGKRIVTDTWVIQSSKEGKLLSTAEFVPRDRGLEAEWDFDMETAIILDRRRLFKDRTFVFTPALKREYGSGFGDIETVAKLGGAKKVVSKPARDALLAEGDAVASGEATLFVGRSKDDVDAQMLVEHGMACYSKDVISVSILRGTLDLDDAKLRAGPAATRSGAKAKNKTAGKKAR